MFNLQKNKILITLSVIALYLSACSAASQSQEQISTAVAQTVQAQNSLTKIASTPTLTPLPLIDFTATTLARMTNTPAPVLGAPGCTVSARLAAENPPDQALMRPSENFLKTWSLENTGTCTWNSTYKLVYWSGDLMDGLSSYPLPEVVAPGETKDISIFLKTPSAEGTYTGYWSIQTPWNAYFGTGTTGDPFYVQVVVSTAKKIVYSITSLTYEVVRDPTFGCPKTVVYTVYATITTNGPLELEYYWAQKDANNSHVKSLVFEQAGVKTLKRTWILGPGVSLNDRWMRIIVTAPVYQEYEKAIIIFNCQP